MTDFLRIRQEQPRLLHRGQDSSWLWVTPRESQNKKQTNKAKQTITTTTKKTSSNEITRGGALDSTEEVTRWREENGRKDNDRKASDSRHLQLLSGAGKHKPHPKALLSLCPCICVCAHACGCVWMHVDVHTHTDIHRHKCNETARKIKAFQEITNRCDSWTPEQPWRGSYRNTPHSVGRQCQLPECRTSTPNKEKTAGKIRGNHKQLSIVNFNVNGLNSRTKRCRLEDWIKKLDPNVYCLQGKDGCW